jgi:hypothetical protein
MFGPVLMRLNARGVADAFSPSAADAPAAEGSGLPSSTSRYRTRRPRASRNKLGGPSRACKGKNIKIKIFIGGRFLGGVRCAGILKDDAAVERCAAFEVA